MLFNIAWILQVQKSGIKNCTNPNICFLNQMRSSKKKKKNVREFLLGHTPPAAYIIFMGKHVYLLLLVLLV